MTVSCQISRLHKIEEFEIVSAQFFRSWPYNGRRFNICVYSTSSWNGCSKVLEGGNMLALTWSLLGKQVGGRLQSPAIRANPSSSLPSDSTISYERAAIRDNCKSNLKCALAAILLLTCLSVAGCGGGAGATAGGGRVHDHQSVLHRRTPYIAGITRR